MIHTWISNRIRHGSGVLLVSALLGGALPAFAQDKVTLKFGTLLPATHYITEQYIKAFTKAAESATNGKVSFQIYPAGQLGKDMPALLDSGVLDVAMISVSVYPHKYPLSSVSELPGVAATACEATNKLSALTKPGGILEEVEFRPQRLQLLSVGVLRPYQLFTRKRIETSADIAGLKIFANGEAMAKTISGIGAVPIKIVSTEVYDAASRGTIDGTMFPYSSLGQYSLQSILNNALEGVTLGAGAFVFAMSDKAWRSLSDDAKRALQKEALATQSTFCAWADVNHVQERAKVIATPGFKTSELPPDQLAAVKKRLGSVASEWAATMDRNGKAGTRVLQAFMSAPSK